MLGLGMVYMTSCDEYCYSMTPNFESPYEYVILCMLGVFYSNVEYVVVSYDVMWVCDLDS